MKYALMRSLLVMVEVNEPVTFQWSYSEKYSGYFFLFKNLNYFQGTKKKIGFNFQFIS
ncbi:unnamed protein product [Larinioides sclopetarius]|uniref:Uncharacterized protein n=1 Tax=Larinioides sclopetarius TaxID=280406 RepID=A0AAV2BZ15_9ARAC